MATQSPVSHTLLAGCWAGGLYSLVYDISLAPKAILIHTWLHLSGKMRSAICFVQAI